MLVERLSEPVPSNALVNTGVHWLKGKARSALCNRTKVPLFTPLVAVIIRVVPLRLTLVMRGVDGVPPETTRYNSLLLIERAAAPPETIPPPATATVEGTVPPTDPALPLPARE